MSRLELGFDPYRQKERPVLPASPQKRRNEYSREIYQNILKNEPIPEHLMTAEESAHKAPDEPDQAGYEIARDWVISNKMASIQKLIGALKLKKTTAMKYLDRMQSEGIISVAAKGKSREVLKQSTGPDKKDVDALKNDSKSEVIDMGGLL